MEHLLRYITPTQLFPLFLLILLFVGFFRYRAVTAAPRDPLSWVGRAPFTFAGVCHPMTRRDLLPVLLLTLVYGLSAFWNLGSMTAPQTFVGFSESRSLSFSLEQEVTLTGLSYYGGLSTGSYTLEVSTDKQQWTSLPTMKQEYTDLFRWQSLWAEHADQIPLTPVQARHFRITASTGSLELGELVLYGGDRQEPLDLTALGLSAPRCAALFDEQETIPDEFTFENGTYFDEIYHPRTAYEHIRGIRPYETTHPPLGKLIIGLGIRLFGMTPFGWRFMGVLFGVLMVPLFYVFVKNLFGKTLVAFCGAALFTFDFMHLTQTRLATIDTYAVFFILAAYYFLWRWLIMPRPWTGAGYLWLFLAGLMFGIGVACKWTVLYAGAGMAILYAINLFTRHAGWSEDPETPGYGNWLLSTLLFSVLSFVVIPAIIYTASYYPYAQVAGDTGLENLITVMRENQTHMFKYHAGVTAGHPYASKWWHWVLDAFPILYYREVLPDGLRSVFSAFNNPVVSWGGLLALIATGLKLARTRSAIALMILVGYLSQLLPWLPISRPTFAYHYFPSILFLALALAFVMDDWLARAPAPHGARVVCAWTGLSVFLYALFYPVLTGLPVDPFFSANFLQWLPSWPA